MWAINYYFLVSHPVPHCLHVYIIQHIGCQRIYVVECQYSLIHTSTSECQLLLFICGMFRYSLTLFSAGGGTHVSPLSRICVLRVCVCIYTCQSFLTILNFQCGKGCNTFSPKKIHHLARRIQSWSILLHFHKTS